MDDSQARALIQAALKPGERLLWSQAAPIRDMSWPPVIAFALFCVVFLFLAWRFFLGRGPHSGVFAFEPGWVFAVLCLVVVGAAGMSWLQETSQAAYGLSNQRLMILSTRPWTSLRSYGPERLRNIELRGDTLAFDYRNWGPRGLGQGYNAHLRGLQDGAAVQALIRAELVDTDRAPR